MTFIIPEQTEPRIRKGPNVLPQDTDAIGAAGRMMWRNTDIVGGATSKTRDIKLGLASQAGNRLGIDALNEWYTANDAGYDHLRPAPATVDDFISMHGVQGYDFVLEAARERAKSEPDKWSDIDLTEDGIKAKVDGELSSESQSDAELVALSPHPVRNMLIGSLGAAFIDPLNIATMPLGGGKTIFSVMRNEAVIGALVEGIQHGARVDFAERTGSPEPSLIDDMLFGAVGGAAIGGVVAGAPATLRGVRYFMEMRKARANATVSPVTHEAATQAAESALLTDSDPLKAVSDIMRQEPMQPKPPLILTPEMRSVTAKTPEPTALAPDPITTTSLPPVAGQAPTTPGETAALAETALNDAIKADQKASKPFLDFLKSAGSVSKAAIRKAEKEGKPAPMGGPRYQIDPDGTLGRELKAMGVTARNTPVGMFKKGGRDDLDNLVANELEDSFPGIMEATRTPYGSDYLDRQGVIDLIVREHGGDSTWLRSRADAVAAQKAADDIARGAYSPQDAFLSGARAEDGFYVDLDRYQFDNPEWQTAVAQDFEAFLTRKNLTLLPAEKDEILRELQTRGGDAEYMVERAFEREIDAEEATQLRRMRGERDADPQEWFPDEGWERVSPEGYVARATDQPGGDALAQPEAVARKPGEPRAGEGGSPVYERTAIGDQSVIPGAERISPQAEIARIKKAQAEAKALQSALRKPNQTRVEDDAGGLFGGAQSDIFSEPSSPKAKPAQISMVEDLRDRIEVEGDFKVDVGEGPVSASSLLREMDDDLDFEDILNACGKRRTE